MPDEAATRWTVTVSKETDIAVRSHLARRGLEKGGLSRFIEGAVRWRLFYQTLAEARAGLADQQQALVDEATAAVSRLSYVLGGEENRGR